ncbi:MULTISPECIES: hypothetical protein [Bradyrhizobium]|uniref:Uncharacterized protein n=1 Tax=Bradyrhizobium septentrionale TaxID=1404411 RepID=A0A973W5X5_9BRAD|nr:MULTISPECIES: hypothetical protein [Bradyrhizobium]QIG94462.1 hypothetical protein G6P99_19675 [Bradyrhizobium sp. 6(2017)]UGY16920.1 hypothetical protein HAP48_0005370 [Bradyrhizobium septentrionale]
MSWFDDGLVFVPTGKTRRIPFGPYIPGLADDVNFLEEPDGFWAALLIDAGSFSDWYYSGAGPMPILKLGSATRAVAHSSMIGMRSRNMPLAW